MVQDNPPLECFRCGWTGVAELTQLHGYTICTSCQLELGLMKDQTIKKHISASRKKQAHHPGSPSYQAQVENRLEEMERHYISSRIKLLHIKSRIQQLESE